MYIMHITSPEEFQVHISESVYVLADFYKKNCPPCTMQNKALELLSQKKKFNKFTLTKLPLERVGEAFFTRLGL